MKLRLDKSGKLALIRRGAPDMIVNLSDGASNLMLDAAGQMMSGGSIELLTPNGGVLARLGLSDPAAQAASGSELQLNTIAEAEAQISGTAKFARIVAADGSEVLGCDVGERGSGAVIELNTTDIRAGAPIRIGNFTLRMP